MSEDDISERLRTAAWRPAAGADRTGIRRLGRWRLAARRATGVAAGLVALVGVVAVVNDGRADPAVVADAPSTPTEPRQTTSADASTGTTVAGDPLAATTSTTPTTRLTPTTTTTTIGEAPNTGRSYDLVVDVPEVGDDALPGAQTNRVVDVVLESDPDIDGGCIWARDRDTGEVYSLGWERDAFQARFVAVGGVEQPTALVSVVNGGEYVRTEKPVRIATGAEGVALSKCDVNGDGPNYGAVVVHDDVGPSPGVGP